MTKKESKVIRKNLEKRAKKPIQKKNWKAVKRLFRKGYGMCNGISKCSSDTGELIERLVKACKTTSVIYVIQNGEISYVHEIEKKRETILLINNDIKNTNCWEIYLYQP